MGEMRKSQPFVWKFRMNEVLVSLWYIMGLWPLAYSMLLLPTGRSSKSKVPVWPFLLLSCFRGAYALLPYFILWNPPTPSIEETELKSWPLIFLESKITAVIGYSKVDILCSESGKQRIILMDQESHDS